MNQSVSLLRVVAIFQAVTVLIASAENHGKRVSVSPFSETVKIEVPKAFESFLGDFDYLDPKVATHKKCYQIGVDGNNFYVSMLSESSKNTPYLATSTFTYDAKQLADSNKSITETSWQTTALDKTQMQKTITTIEIKTPDTIVVTQDVFVKGLFNYLGNGKLNKKIVTQIKKASDSVTITKTVTDYSVTPSKVEELKLDEKKVIPEFRMIKVVQE